MAKGEMMGIEKLGIFEDLQSKGAIYLPKTPRLARPLPGLSITERRETIAALAREAVDQAIKDAITQEVDRRRGELLSLAAPSGPSLEALMKAIVTASGISSAIIMGTRRDKPVSRARALFWYLASALRKDLTYAELAKVAGSKDHTSAMHAVRRFPTTRLGDPLVSYCLHPAIVAYLHAADQSPRHRV